MEKRDIWQTIIGITAVVSLILSGFNSCSEKARSEGNIEARITSLEESQRILLSDTKKLGVAFSAIRERVQSQHPNLPPLPSLQLMSPTKMNN